MFIVCFIVLIIICFFVDGLVLLVLVLGALLGEGLPFVDDQLARVPRLHIR